MVTASNQSKGDQGPEDWMPVRTAFHCIYIRSWVQVKYYYVSHLLLNTFTRRSEKSSP